MRAAVLARNACVGDAIGERVAAKVRCLLQRGWEVRLFVESADMLHPELTLLTCRTSARDLWHTPSRRDWLCQTDLILVEFGIASDLLALLPALPRPRPWIVAEYHGVTPPDLWPEQNWQLVRTQNDRTLLWCADRITVLSSFAEAELLQATGLPCQRARRHPGFVLSGGTRAASAVPTLSRLGLDRATVLLFVGRLAPNKRPRLLIEAVHRLRDRNPPVHAVFLGRDDDLYAVEAQRCRRLAQRLRVGDRVHWCGWVGPDELRAWYAAADVLVVPSLHEGFCVPVIEAMAAGLPVVAARAAALPETVGSAGLTFHPDDADDLARQVERVVSGSPGPAGPTASPHQPRRVAVVTPRYGPGFAGGAERSLCRIAAALQASGWEVEVYTTTASDEAGHHREQSPGTQKEAGWPVHRFAARPGDGKRLRKLLTQADADAGEIAACLPSSPDLLAALCRRRERYAAILVGPYASGLCWDIAASLHERCVVVPCLHDDALAHHPALPELLRNAAGILYHSEAERHLADARLGINHPISEVVGTWLEPGRGDAQRGQARCGPNYLVYCGRFLPEKGFDLLLTWMGRLAQTDPRVPRLVVLGQDGRDLPREPWLLGLGYVPEGVKDDVVAGAQALVLLSPHESLSLAALEAWSQGVPVIASSRSAVLSAHVRQSGGGVLVGDFDEFAQAVASLREEPGLWQERGRKGRAYVQQQYGCRDAFAARIEAVLERMRRPLREVLAEAGRQRAAQFRYEHWRACFEALLEEVSATSAPPIQHKVRIEPTCSEVQAARDWQEVSVPIRLENLGDWPLAARGPARFGVRAWVRPDRASVPAEGLAEEQELGEGCRGHRGRSVWLTEHLPPGGKALVYLPVPVPAVEGRYQVEIETLQNWPGQTLCQPLTLEVSQQPADVRFPRVVAAVADIRSRLAQLAAIRQLPDDYVDISHGLLARWKVWLKQKLLHNFRTAYVDVLAQQQSQVNDMILAILGQLVEVLQAHQPMPLAPGPAAARLLRRLWRKQQDLEKRLRRLERRLARWMQTRS
jgi:glycosyltransferase involved in cell wall biosynthesis